MKKNQISLNGVQVVFGRILQVLMIAISLFHLFRSFYVHFDSASSHQLRYAEYAILALFGIAGVVYLFYGWFKAKDTVPLIKNNIRRLLCPEQLLLIAMFIWYLLSCSAAGKHFGNNWFRYNELFLLDTAVSFFIFFPIALALGKNLQKTTGIIIPAIITILTGLIFFVLWNVFQNNVMYTPDSGIGMSSSRNLTISAHYNIVGMYEIVVMLVCLILAFKTHFNLMRPIYALFGLIHWVTVVLTQSRTSYFSAIFAVAAGVFIISCIILKNRLSRLPRLAVGVLASIIVALIMDASREWIFALFEACSHLSEILAAQGQAVSGELRELAIDAPVNSRFALWGASVKSMFHNVHHFLFGVTTAGVYNALETFAEGFYGVYTHNQFLEVAVSSGIPNLILYLIWLILICKNCLRIGLSSVQNISLGERLIPIIILCLVVANLPEGRLIGHSYMPGSIFFLLCGWTSMKARTLPPVSLKEFF